MQRERLKSKQAFLSHQDTSLAVAHWREKAEDFRLLERVHNNWMLGENSLSKDKFRAKWIRKPGAGSILQMSSVVKDTEDGRYRPTLYGFTILVAASSKNCSALLGACRLVYAHLRKRVDESMVGSTAIDFDQLTLESGLAADTLEKSVALLSDGSIGIHLNRIPGQAATVSVQEYVLQYRNLWEYLALIIKMPTADWGSFGALDIFDIDRRSQYSRIFALVPEGTKQFSKCLDRLDTEPDAAITSARVLVEACLNWVAHDAGLEMGSSKSPAKLFQFCIQSLGMDNGSGNFGITQMVKGMDMALEGLAHLRNNLGDAHARKIGQPAAARPQARIAVLLSIAVSAYLIEMREAQKCIKP